MFHRLTLEHTISAHKWILGSFRASVLCIKVPKSPPSDTPACMGLFRHHSSTLVCVTPQLLEGFASAAVFSQLDETRAGQVLLLLFTLSRGARSPRLFSFSPSQGHLLGPLRDPCCKNVTASWCHEVAAIVVTRNQRSEGTRLVRFSMLSRHRAWRTVVKMRCSEGFCKLCVHRAEKVFKKEPRLLFLVGPSISTLG